MFIVAQFTIARTWKQGKCPSTEEWIKNIRSIYTMNITQSLKEQNNIICSNMNVPGDYHT